MPPALLLWVALLLVSVWAERPEAAVVDVDVGDHGVTQRGSAAASHNQTAVEAFSGHHHGVDDRLKCESSRAVSLPNNILI